MQLGATRISAHIVDTHGNTVGSRYCTGQLLICHNSVCTVQHINTCTHVSSGNHALQPPQLRFTLASCRRASEGQVVAQRVHHSLQSALEAHMLPAIAARRQHWSHRSNPVSYRGQLLTYSACACTVWVAECTGYTHFPSGNHTPPAGYSCCANPTSYWEGSYRQDAAQRVRHDQQYTLGSHMLPAPATETAGLTLLTTGRTVTDRSRRRVYSMACSTHCVYACSQR